MLPVNDLEILGRIIIAIKTYRLQKQDNHNSASHAAMDVYLQRHLLEQDWKFWKHLQANQGTDC